MQQCVEKYLKARLIEAAIVPPKTHDIEKLLMLALPMEPSWSIWQPACAAITDHAVESRYPGRTTSSQETTALLKVTKRIRAAVRLSLGLPGS